MCFDIEYGDFGGVLTSWNKLTRLSLFHNATNAPGIPFVPGSLRLLHIHVLHSTSLLDFPPLPQGSVFSMGLLILDISSDHGAAHTALANLEQLHPSVGTACKHLRLLCGTRHEKGSLHDVLPFLAMHSQLLSSTGTHEVSAMHVKVKPGEIPQLASLFESVTFMGMVNYEVTSLHVLREAASLPGLAGLQLRFEVDESRACEVKTAHFAGQVRQQAVPLTIQYHAFPFIDDEDVPDWLLQIKWECDDATAGLPARVALTGVPCKFAKWSTASMEPSGRTELREKGQVHKVTKPTSA
ncbi:hypothetical protein DUNSADRAFT_8099 [Dunaliella salina]|uniref:Uncharacterized protein n=1 Tax=Dunaliella salina TaxID=3046 RepID=A0ABQ7GK01_DUNSA|nr:hypothetical protein DUNSADRAFT_8099 [Dunaliella salina]|eukprot:KAF5834950.1 hypothetical protein DUNSADRAFT_8099 [Dunaliella salina]